jgi:hypothetical protein
MQMGHERFSASLFAKEVKPVKQCIQCDREYPDTENFCEMDGAYLLDMEDLELPEGVCPACMGLSPGIAADGKTIMHCDLCHDTGRVTLEQARNWEEEMRARYAGRKGFSG